MSRLVIFHKQLGDTVLLEPVLRKHAQASGGVVDLLCPPAFEPLISLMSCARIASGRRRWLPDSVWAYDWGGRTTRAAVVTLCRDKHLLIPNGEWLCLRHRLGFQHHHVRSYQDRHISRYFWEETPVPGTPGYFSHVRLEMPPDAWAASFAAKEPYVLLNPVSAWRRKSYDAAKWAEVLSYAREIGLPRVLMSGGVDKWQRSHCAEIASAAKNMGVLVEDVSGCTNLKQFMHLVSRAALVLCVDGAASHLARGFGVPCLTIFGPSYRWMWHEQDTLNAAVDASEAGIGPRPAAFFIPVQSVIDALNCLVASVQFAVPAA
jgi:hypothetical protein